MVLTSKFLSRCLPLSTPTPTNPTFKFLPPFLSQTHTPSSSPLPTTPSFATILQQIKHQRPLQQAHALLITSALANNVFLSNRLINSYSSLGLLPIAHHIFQQMPLKNVVSWTILISGLSKNGLFMEALEVFCQMKDSGAAPNAVTFVSVLPACAHLGMFRIGKSIHGLLIRWGIEMNVYVETSLVDLYARCGSLGIARRLFEKMSQRNVVSWNTIISGYSENGLGEEALNLYKRMQRKMVHGFMIKCGFENDELVVTALMDMYVKCECIEDGYQVFCMKLVKDVVAWTLMISSFSEVGYGNKAMELFHEMIAEGDVKLDSVSLIAVLSSCARLGALQQGRRVHGLTKKIGFEDDVFVGSALIDMYANCGSLENARSVFDGMAKKDVVCWNAMIAANGMNGCGADAVGLFFQMKDLGLNPDAATYVSVLCACSHAGLVDQGICIFYSMVDELDSDVRPNLQHYACVVDLLGRAGLLNDACSLINNMPLQPDTGVYGALLGACRNHENINLGLEVSEKLFEMDPQDAGYYVLLANMYAVAGNWEGVKTSRVFLRSKGLKKAPGYSSIEIDREVYAFMAGDRDHPQYDDIDKFLKALIIKIEESGYVPDTKFVFQDVADDVKRDLLYHHSEKLAIAFGLLRTQPGIAIRITKNLRMCNDCHTASKFISSAAGREIVVKDANRFHYFRDGVCSCKDYW
ncbi:putative pentatricopeptide repeat-containing protein [Cinnamomum micranthum f. kanehirae]|uniref:Putative pentatricopeptide repeat-containing protein n=1 Tax=Cinnamomum micranthum f. kanehirae TaxID=337451 RepID=A0A3S3MIY1_9MAGN|nr:putative pentatricopeptide repeat-containing protein [Cinnamomum micranthum f. kanehirae]